MGQAPGLSGALSPAPALTLQLCTQGTFIMPKNPKPETIAISALRRIEDDPVSATRGLQLTQDPDDNLFLECADAARADYLATGNQRRFPRFWKQTKVVTSREFLSIVAPHVIS